MSRSFNENEALGNVGYSLADLVGDDYVRAVVEAQAFLTGFAADAFSACGFGKVDFFPEEFAARCDALALRTGEKVCAGCANDNAGAPTDAYAKAQRSALAPLAGLGCTRLGEDGRLYFLAKSEHYHAPLGHQFPGYRLLEHAARLGIPNATHNNTRGLITRTLERELVRVANGLPRGDGAALLKVLASDDARTLNRVINLETGSLAMESALKMMLARFYRLDATYPPPPYAGRVPVFFVVGAPDGGGPEANYHGTTVLAQTLRGMWPEFAAKAEGAGLYRVVAVRANDFADFAAQVARFDAGPTKVAGFFHEIVLMNYGGICLTRDYLHPCYEQCRAHDIPVVVDEIQSCLWSPELFMFREYGLAPDFVSVGKGFPGGQYPASKIITNAAMDTLNQFGALVTNGQEELASLAYLVTMRFVEDNAGAVRQLGAYYHARARDLARRHPTALKGVEGAGHLTTLVFHAPEPTLAFVARMTGRGFDVSAQTYKANCPPVALTKLPLIASRRVMDFVLAAMEDALPC